LPGHQHADVDAQLRDLGLFASCCWWWSGIVLTKIVPNGTTLLASVVMGASVKEAGSETSGPPAPDNLNWLLAWVSHALATETTAALQRFSVTPRGHCVLSTAMRGEYTQTALAATIGLDKTTMVVTIDELEAHGLAERVPSEHDRRARVIKVTPAGKRLVARGEREVARIEADVLGSLPARQRVALVDALSVLAQGRLSEPVACEQAPRRRAPRA